MARKKNQNGISPAGKIAILFVLFGIPCLFFASSWGLSKIYEIAPMAIVGVILLVETIYTAYTVGLLYKFYNESAPILRIVPCLCEVMLIDIKYRTPCYILYILAIICGGCSQLPYSVMGVLGETFATSAPFYLLLAALVLLLIVQIIKGIGLIDCMKDIAERWHKQTHVGVGVFDKFIPLGFIPFVRVMALYALNKPLSTMVTFMGTNVDDGDREVTFSEE